MDLKETNEITVKIKCKLAELYNILDKKGFKISDKFSIDDYYFIPSNLKLQEIKVLKD